MAKGGRRRTTWTKETVPKSKGRPKGAKDKIPRGSVDGICRVIAHGHAETIYDAIVRGLKARGPVSLGFVRFVAERVDGLPREHITVDGGINIRVTAKHELLVRLARLADTRDPGGVRQLADGRASGGAVV